MCPGKPCKTDEHWNNTSNEDVIIYAMVYFFRIN